MATMQTIRQKGMMFFERDMMLKTAIREEKATRATNKKRLERLQSAYSSTAHGRKKTLAKSAAKAKRRRADEGKESGRQDGLSATADFSADQGTGDDAGSSL